MSKHEIEQAARQMVAESGLINLSRRSLCERVGISEGSFRHVMGKTFTDFMSELKKDERTDRLYPVNRSRADPELRREQILGAAVELARECGYTCVTRNAVAERAGVSQGLVSRHFSTVKQLKRAVMRSAVQRGMADVVAQGLAAGDPQAQKAPVELKKEAVKTFTE